MNFFTEKSEEFIDELLEIAEDDLQDLIIASIRIELRKWFVDKLPSIYVEGMAHDPHMLKEIKRAYNVVRLLDQALVKCVDSG